jgi:hypothetical protein
MPVRVSGKSGVQRSLNQTRQKTIETSNIGSLASSKDGELFTTLEGGILYLNAKKNGKLWRLPMSHDGDFHVKRNLHVNGNINRGGTGSGSYNGKKITTGKGGTGQDLSGSTGIITVSSGTVAADATPAVNLTDATNVPLNQIKSGTTLAKSAVSTSSTWATGDIPNLPASKITSGTLAKARGGFGADATTVSVALITDNIESTGIKSGRTLGDGIESQIIWSDEGLAKEAAGEEAPDGLIWTETSTSYVTKVAFNYFHESENKSMTMVCNLRSSDNERDAYAKLLISALSTGASSNAGAQPGSALKNVEVDADQDTFVNKKGEIDLTASTALSNATQYRVEVQLKAQSGASNTAYMTGLTILTFGA